MVFENLNPKLQELVKERFAEPTLPQKLAIPKILEGKDILLISETGTGKTESCILPVLNLVIEQKPEPISVLYITPLKALNRDLLDRLIWWANKLELDIAVRHGDTSPYARRQQVEFPPKMLIVTLETLQPILTGKRLRELLKNVKWVVLDEVHETVDSKRGIQLALGLERLKQLCGDFQLIMLSATVGDPENVAKFFAGSKADDIEIIRAETPKQFEIRVINPKPKKGDSEIAKKVFAPKETAARLRMTIDLIKGARSTLTFTNTRDFAEILMSRMKSIDKKFPVEIHHSSLSKQVRIKAEKQFKDEKLKSLIATSSLQLGIDIGSIDLVLQYQSPRTVTQLIQRVGRSGHGLDRVSRGILISTDEDDCFESAVIARKALAGELEPARLHTNSLDVLAHQLVGLTLEYWKLEMPRAYQMVKSATPYNKLSYTEFLEVCKQLQRLGLVWLEDTIKKKRRGFQYYFDHLSTIPDTKQYRVFNTLEQSFVGVLDEEFVAIHGNPGTTFIVKGEPWRIVEVEDDRILVEPSDDMEAAVPGWEGEMIPVPFSIAQEVGRLRGEIAKKLDKKTREEVMADLQQRYPIDINTAKKMVDIIRKQKTFGFIPTDKELLVEDFEDLVIIHAPFGSLANQTLGRFLTALITARVGSVGLRTDPYRIIIEFQQKNVELLKEILFSTNPNFLRTYLEMSLGKSELFEWKFVHVAKRFGAIARGAQYGKARMKRIIEDYAGTPIYKETMRELETEKLDIPLATELMKMIQKNEIKVSFRRGLSPLGKIGVIHKYAELVGPLKPEKEIFELFKRRVASTETRLTCMNCGKWSQSYTIEEMPEDVQCPHCDARLLTIVHPKNTRIQKIIEKKLRHSELGQDESALYNRARQTADLFLTYRKLAALVLAGRGVGPQTAKRILRKYHKDEDALFRDILESERQWLKTRRYWKV